MPKITPLPAKSLRKIFERAGFPDDVVVVPVAVSIDALKNSPISESVFIKSIYREGVAV